jgi:hypothetical protein
MNGDPVRTVGKPVLEPGPGKSASILNLALPATELLPAFCCGLRSLYVMVRNHRLDSATVRREDEIMRALKWSPSEKLIARKAFDKALKIELQEIVVEAKEMAAAVREASQLWNLEGWLTQRRRQIERKYDYRYSVLPLVFAALVKEGRISERDLNGLDLEKIGLILGTASSF